MLPSELTYTYVFIYLIAWEYKNGQCKTENMKHRIKGICSCFYIFISLYSLIYMIICIQSWSSEAHTGKTSPPKTRPHF